MSTATAAVNSASTTAMAPVKDVELRVPCYCEENVWRLAYRKWKQQADSKKYYAVFVSTPSKCVCFFHQKASGNPLKPVFWDYHVLLFEYDATTQTTVNNKQPVSAVGFLQGSDSFGPLNCFLCVNLCYKYDEN